MPEERRNIIMTNKQMNSKLENIIEVHNSEVFEFKDIVNPKIQNKITEAYCNFYEKYLSQSNALEEIVNRKPNLKTWLFKAGTNKIFVMDSGSVEDFVESINPTKKSHGIIFLQEVDSNKVFEDRNVLAAAVDFINLPAHSKAARAEAIEFIAEAAKELFHKK
jgi:hypothetical protein